MLQNIIIWLIESIQFGYPVILILLVIFHLSKIKIKRFDHTLVLQIINILTAICALGMLFWNFEFVTSAFDINITNNVNPRNGHSSVTKVMAFIFTLCGILLPQLFWIKKIRSAIWTSFFIMILMNANVILVLYTVIVTSQGRDHVAPFVTTVNSFFNNVIPVLITYLGLIFIIYFVYIKTIVKKFSKY